MIKYYQEIEHIITEELGIQFYEITKSDSVRITFNLSGIKITCKRNITPKEFREKVSEELVNLLSNMIASEESKLFIIKNRINAFKKIHSDHIEFVDGIMVGDIDTLEPLKDVVEKVNRINKRRNNII